jgi:MFS family permease
MFRLSQLQFTSLFFILNRIAFIFSGLVYTTRLTSQFHLNNQQTMGLNVIFFISSMILEVPTGYIGDKFGYKTSINLGVLGWFVGTAIYTYSSTYYLFGIAEVLSALGSAFLSGSLDAWVGKQFINYEDYSLFKRNLNQKARIIGIIFALLAGFISEKIGFDGVYLISTITFFVCFLLTLSFKDYPLEEHNKEIQGFKPSLKYFCTSPKLLTLSFLGFSNFIWLTPIFMLWGPIIKQDMNLSSYWLGILSSILSLGIFLGGVLESKIQHKLNSKPFVTEFLLQIVKGLTIVIFSFTINTNLIPFIISFFIFEIAHEVNAQFSTLNANKYWKGSPNEATISSIYSLFVRLGGAVGNLTLGVVADNIGRSQTITLSGVMMIFFSLVTYILYLIKKKVNR